MKRLLNRIKGVGEAVLNEIAGFFLSFGGIGVMLALAVASLLITVYIGFKMPWK